MALDRRLFVDSSVNTGDVSDSFSDQQTRQIIRDEFLRDTTVTIVLVGQETKHRKHIDWEIFSSMFDGKINKRSGILVINLPTISEVAIVASEEEKNIIYPDIPLWKPIPQRKLLESHYPHMPERIIDNLLERFVRLSVVPWSRIANYPENLRFLIDVAHQGRFHCKYNLSRSMRRMNSLSPLTKLSIQVNNDPKNSDY